MTAKVIEAMLLAIRWRQMREYCMDTKGITCGECPYNDMKACDVASTEEILARCADTFNEWLFGSQKTEEVSGGDSE